MQKLITDILKKHSFAVILNIIGLIGNMVNLYIVTKLYPLVETDRRIEYQIQATNVRIDNEQQAREQHDKYIIEKIDEFKKYNSDQFESVKDLIRRN